MEEVNEGIGSQKDNGGMAACMKKIMKATKGCGQLLSNDTFFSDI